MDSFLPHADIKVFLEADDEERAKRILKDNREHEKSNDLDETIKNIKKREESEQKRYMKYYGTDYLDKKLYNFFIDTTNIAPNQVVDKIVEFVEKKR
ncbi:(d)CMP kinase [Candidatus Woesearchaeota archaeon]|nr:(d)CMP kinase [Candidatus Woesearchaeota archaeon]